jgi:glycosyltransferase involved in cell wall biosynthesis
MTAKVLYLSFDGMTDPLGRSQVLPYLTGLAARGHDIRIVSLEKRSALGKGGETVSAICADAGIRWAPLAYHDRPPLVSTLLNLRALQRAAEAALVEHSADFVHCRSDLPGIVGLRLRRRFGIPVLYDMRAFWPDERAEGGSWDQSSLLWRAVFNYFKRRQRELLATADEVVALSDDGARAIAELKVRECALPVTVIPCCADFDLFVPPTTLTRAAARAELGLAGDSPLLVHVGSIGANCLLDEMIDFFTVYREQRPGAQFLLVAPSGEGAIRASASRRGVQDSVHVRSADRDEVPRWLGAADAGIMFVRPVWSKRAASPTKLGEMLAVGLPVVANAGVGDVRAILEKAGAGVTVDRFNGEAYRSAIGGLERMPPALEIRRAGKPWFDLAVGIAAYDGIYERLARSVRG